MSADNFGISSLLLLSSIRSQGLNSGLAHWDIPPDGVLSYFMKISYNCYWTFGYFMDSLSFSPSPALFFYCSEPLRLGCKEKGGGEAMTLSDCFLMVAVSLSLGQAWSGYLIILFIFLHMTTWQISTNTNQPPTSQSANSSNQPISQ